MAEIPENANITILNRNEKKAREMISKLGLKKVPGIIRVTFRKKDNQIYAIEKPEVFRSVGGNYVVFGEAKVDNFTQRLAAAQQQAAQQPATKTPEDIQADLQAAADANESGEAKTEAADENVEVGDLNEDDVELVVQQTNASKAHAIKALKEHDGDIVNAIMSLSK
ncbi:Nascent polypeptide-associated complex subunit alpha [Nakaseomyces bracarensis]|uniref:Nascent polypeptide-associated complex subunit alpha n=1 Tax=Nakaseomyces bracarensis TaxID=273131 RepID=A0ABR4NMX0_9SACH